MNLSTSEKRTIRIAGSVLGVYLLFFCAQHAWKFIAAQRAKYTALVQQADKYRVELKPYQSRVELAQKLMRDFRLDPSRLSRPSVVADASAAILKAAASNGIQLGPIRESAARQSNKELASIQLDCTGQVAAVLAFIHNFQSIGYPIIVDSVQINPEPSKPGMLKVHLALVILDFTEWKVEQAPTHA